MKRKKTFEFISLIFASLISLFVYSAYVFQKDNLIIDKVVISGNKVLGSKELFGVVSEEMSGFYFYLFPKSNLFIYPKNKIKEKILSEYLRAEDVTINFLELKKIALIIKEREPAYVWCPHAECFYLDYNGFSFDIVKEKETSLLKIFGEDTVSILKKDNKLGKRMMDGDKLKKISMFISQAEGIIRENINKEYKISHIEVTPENNFSLYISDSDKNNWVIKFTTRKEGVLNDSLASAQNSILKSEEDMGDFESRLVRVLRNMSITFKTDTFIDNLKKSGGVIEYVDLRYGKKVFYKFREASKDLNQSSVVLQ